MSDNIDDLKFHQLADLFPMLDETQSDELAKDIAANGLLEPIVLLDGQILDGRNRYRACLKAGVEPKMINYEGQNPEAYVVSLNLRRRHLSESQRAMVAAKIEAISPGRPRKDANLHLLRTDAAKLLNVSPRSVASAQSVVANGSDELVAAVENGDVSVSCAAEISTLPQNCQSEVIALTKDQIVKEANRIRRERKQIAKEAKDAAKRAIPDDLPLICDRYQIICSDIQNAGFTEGGVDCIITDPPYMAEYLDCYKWLSDAASLWLKPNGILAVMCGQAHLPQVIENLCSNPDITYRWTLSYQTPGGQAAQVFDRKINSFWKPVIIFQKGQPQDWFSDVAFSRANDNDKRFHEWSQSESGMADLVERLTLPGQLICDPFMGGGTTAVVALRMNRCFIGCDVDEMSVKVAAERIHKLINDAA